MELDPRGVKVIVYPNVPADKRTELEREFLQFASSVTLEEAKLGQAWNAPDLSLPAQIVVSFGTSLAATALYAQSSDFYNALRKAARRALDTAANLPSLWRGPSGREIIPPPLSYSLEFGDNQLVRFVFPPGLDEESIDQAVSAIAVAMPQAVKGSGDQESAETGPRQSLSFVYSAEQGQWVELMDFILQSVRAAKAKKNKRGH